MTFISVKPENNQQITVTIIYVVISVLIVFNCAYFPKYAYLMLGLIFVCLLFFLAIYKLETALLFTLFIFPLIPRYFGVDLGHGLPIINTQRILLGAIYLGWIFRNIATKGKILPKTQLDRPILVLLLIQLCSVFLTTNYLRVSLLKLFSLLFEQYLLFYVVVDTIHTKTQLKKIISVLIISLVLVSLIGIAEYFSGHYFFASVKPVRAELQSSYEVQWTRLGTLRVQSSMGSGRILGMCLILLIPISLLSAAYDDTSSRKVLWGVASVIFLLTLYFTKSRACLLGFLISLLVIFPRYKKHIFIGITAVIMVTLLMSFLQTPVLSNEIFRMKAMIFSIFHPSAYLDDAVGGEMATAALSRITTQKEVLNLILQKPILGYGLHWPSELITTGSDVNWYSGLMLSSGIVVLILFFWIVIRVIRRLFNCFKNAEDRYYRILALALTGAIIAFLVPLGVGLSIGAFYLFWVLIAIATIITKKSFQPKTRRKNENSSNRDSRNVRERGLSEIEKVRA